MMTWERLRQPTGIASDPAGSCSQAARDPGLDGRTRKPRLSTNPCKPASTRHSRTGRTPDRKEKKEAAPLRTKPRKRAAKRRKNARGVLVWSRVAAGQAPRRKRRHPPRKTHWTNTSARRRADRSHPSRAGRTG